MACRSHPLLTVQQQIEHMEASGVKFELMSEADALSYLRKNNNYFRLRAYRRGFDKYHGGLNDGKYVNLDFAMLADLATIDMHLRYEVFPMTLEIEHFSKVLLLDQVESHGEDGYGIVRDFLDTYNNQDNREDGYNPVLGEINRGKNGPYTRDLIKHYENTGYPIWAFIELISFGRFNELWRFCARRFEDRKMARCFYLLQSAKGIRNACGHNTCILNDVGSCVAQHPADKTIRAAIGRIGIQPKMATTKLSNDRIIQLTTTLYLHHEIASSGVYRARSIKLNQLVCRMKRHEEWYDKNQQISSFFDYTQQLVEGWYPVEK